MPTQGNCRDVSVDFIRTRVEQVRLINEERGNPSLGSIAHPNILSVINEVLEGRTDFASKELLLELALKNNSKWAAASTISVSFLDDPLGLKEKIMKYAREWCQYANISFDVVPTKASQIRISFIPP